MSDRTDTYEAVSKKRAAGMTDSEFIPLDDLVYAPLHALAKSNGQLQAYIIEAIRSMGTLRQNGKEETIHLNHINIAYDQVRAEEEEGCCVDSLQLQVPLMSIVPMANLNVEKAEISFSTEVKAIVNLDTGVAGINARICAPSQRDTDFLPKVSYKLQVSSVPATEGVLRLTDALSANHVVKKLDTTPVAVGGDMGNDEQKAALWENNQLRAKIARLKQLHQKIADMINEQERLHQIGKDVFEDGICEFDKDKYLMAQAGILNRIMEYQEKIIDREILHGLDKDYE